MNQIEQNFDGNKYACCYLDDGLFKMRVFGDAPRSHVEALADEVCFNDLINLDNHTMPIDDFQYPMITCCFLTDDLIFVNFFYNKDVSHFHFVWDDELKRMHGPVQVKLGNICSGKNFPMNSFYNMEKNEVYVFYRQGQAFKVNPETLDYGIEQMNTRDIGQLILYQNKVLVVRSSGKILFFKQEREDKFSPLHWVQY